VQATVLLRLGGRAPSRDHRLLWEIPHLVRLGGVLRPHHGSRHGDDKPSAQPCGTVGSRTWRTHGRVLRAEVRFWDVPTANNLDGSATSHANAWCHLAWFFFRKVEAASLKRRCLSRVPLNGHSQTPTSRQQSYCAVRGTRSTWAVLGLGDANSTDATFVGFVFNGASTHQPHGDGRSPSCEAVSATWNHFTDCSKGLK